MRVPRSHRTLPLLVALLLALGACADDGTEAAPASSPVPDATAIPATPSPSPEPDQSPDPEPDQSPDPEPDQSPDPEPTTSETVTLPGEPYEGPPLGGEPALLAVIGVAADDVLQVRSGPSVEAEIIAALDPLATDVRATGRARLLPRSIWVELEIDGAAGWSNSSFLAFLGGTDDITSQILDAAAERPRAETLVALARDVAQLRASMDPPSRIVISRAPSVGDLGEVTVDVVGIGDDAVVGERLVVFATVDNSGEGFTLRTVEATTLCGRGPTDGGPCP